MKTNKVDRRVKYTQMLLKDCLVLLMKDNPISKVSVKSLCDAADINRSTFYAHYSDQYALLKQLENDVIVELEKYISIQAFSKETAQTVEAMNQILVYIAKNADLFKVLLSDNGDSSFHRSIMLMAQQKTIEVLQNDKRIGARTSEYLQGFVITGALNIVRKWLEDGMVETTERMSEMTAKLLYQGLSGFYL